MYSRYHRSPFWEESKPERREPVSNRQPAASVAVPEKTSADNGLFSFVKGMDTGDLLLAAIILFLLIESNDIELIIALAIVLLG